MTYIETWKDLNKLENNFGLKLEIMELPTSSKPPCYLVTVNDSEKDYSLGSWSEEYLEDVIEVINKFGFNLEFEEGLYKVCKELEEVLTPVNYEDNVNVQNYTLNYHKDENWYLDYSPHKVTGALYFDSYVNTTKIDCLSRLSPEEVDKVLKRLGWL